MEAAATSLQGQLQTVQRSMEDLHTSQMEDKEHENTLLRQFAGEVATICNSQALLADLAEKTQEEARAQRAANTDRKRVDLYYEYGDQDIRMDARTGAQQHTLKGHSGLVTAVHFSPDGSKLASASYDEKVIVWDASTGAQQHTLKGHSDLVTAVHFSPDGSKLASASYDEKVIVWDASTGEQLHTLEGHLGAVNAVHFSPDGSKLASASNDGKVIVWDASTGKQLHTLEGHSDRVDTVQFSPDGLILASGLSNGTVRLLANGTGHSRQKHGHVSLELNTTSHKYGSRLQGLFLPPSPQALQNLVKEGTMGSVLRCLRKILTRWPAETSAGSPNWSRTDSN
jgi:WD40 repeat protein